MSAGSQTAPAETKSSLDFRQWWESCLQQLRRIPPRPALLAILLILIALIGWKLFVSSHAATLKIQGQHGFRTAELSVWVDGDLLKQFDLSGASKRRFGVLQSVQGSFSQSMQVPAGTHAIRIDISSAADNYDRSTEIAGDFVAKGQRVLYVNADRKNGNPLLSWRDSVHVSKEQAVLPDYMKLVTSFLLTAGGSVLSAAIGFLVQERLRALKAARAKLQQQP